MLLDTAATGFYSMKRIFLTLLVLSLNFQTMAQKVGLVLSGGAAKGLAHVGVLKALEENEIPIDYVVGTSMGGIIAGCYAAGMSPDQIEHIVLSDHFMRWINGLPEPGYNYFYHQGDDNPHFLKLNLKLDSILNLQINTSIASDVSLNFALAEQMALASAIARNNFDSLFVPLRVVAADIFTQNQVILSNGSLSDALRATQTVPFFYNPIRVEGKYLFDGGVYNNFPVDVIQETFDPDVVIGVNVSTKIYNEYPYDMDEKLIANSLLFLLLDKSDPASVPESGIYIQPNLKGYTSFDFNRARSLIDSGYVQTLRQMDEIKRKISKRVSCDEITERRNRFNNRNPALIFDAVTLKGFNQKQQRYIRRMFRYNPENPKPLYYGNIKSGYYRLVSDNYFNNVYPNIIHDSTTNRFRFNLTRRPQKNFQIDFGGVIATRDISNIFLGLNLYHFNTMLLHLYTGFHTGSLYKSAVVSLRTDFPFRLYVEPRFVYNAFDYLESDDLLRDITNPTVLKRFSREYGVHFGAPLGKRFKGDISFGGLSNIDRYINGTVFVSADTLDEIRLSGFKGQLSVSASSLNRKQYASSGKAISLTAQCFMVDEDFTPGNTSLRSRPEKNHHRWVRVKARAEQYFNLGWYSPGYLVEGVFSNQPFFQNYKGTIINAPGFYPLQDSRTHLLENFRAFNYVAAGFRNVFTLNHRLDFRLEGYLFKPLEYLREDPSQKAYVMRDFESLYFAGTGGLVFHSPIGPVSLSANYYDDSENRFGVLLHVGFLLFNNHSLD